MFQVLDTRHYKNVRAVVYINLDDDSSYIKRNFTFQIDRKGKYDVFDHILIWMIEKQGFHKVFPQILH